MNFRSLLGLPESRSLSFQEVWGSGGNWSAVSRSGKKVTPKSAMAVTAVYGSVRLISENIATFPVDSFIREGGARRPFRPRPEWLSFSTGPFNRIQVIGQTMTSLLLSGNAYLATYRDGTGRILWMEVLDPAGVEPERAGAVVNYRVGGDLLSRLDILHIPGMSLPGSIKGISPIEAARETVGVSIAATEYAATFFGNGATPGGLVEVAGQLSDTGRAALIESWEAKHRGAGNANRLAVLTEGAKFHPISISPEDSQLIETRQFQVQDIARIFGVPPHLLAESSGSTSWGSGLAEQNSGFHQQALRPWIERLEAGLSWAMASEGTTPQAFIKFNPDALLRGDTEKRMQSYVQGLNAGVYSINEVRAWEDLPPIPGGDHHMVPLNMTPAGTIPTEAK